jgi:uncharacterized protein (UPF0332 family)
VLNEDWIDLAKHRLATSLDDYNGATNLTNCNQYRIANNRAYYSILHAIRAVLALDGVDFKKHSAVISYFNQHYISTGIINKEHSKFIKQAGTIRNLSDYDDFYIANRTETKALVESAKVFYDAIESYLNTRFDESE